MPGLLAVKRTNAARSVSGAPLFEISRVFSELVILRGAVDTDLNRLLLRRLKTVA